MAQYSYYLCMLCRPEQLPTTEMNRSHGGPESLAAKLDVNGGLRRRISSSGLLRLRWITEGYLHG